MQLVASCATVLYPSHKKITIHTSSPATIVVEQDTVRTLNNRAILEVARKKQVLNVSVFTDSITKQLQIQPHNAFLYWANIGWNYGLGMLIDRNNPKRYTYPSRLYLNTKDSTTAVFRYPALHYQGEQYLRISLPHINNFNIVPEQGSRKNSTGFWGASIGYEYYHRPNQFIGISYAAVANLIVPVPAPVRVDGGFEEIVEQTVAIYNSHHMKRFTLGYGLAYVKNRWSPSFNWQNDPSTVNRTNSKTMQSWGFIFPEYYQVGERFNLGMVYRPTWIRPAASTKFLYEHLISIDFSWRLPLR